MKTKLAAVLDLIGTVAVIASLLFLTFELRQSNQIAKSTITYELGNNISQLNEIVWTNPDVAALHVRIRNPEYVPTDVEEEMLRAEARRFMNLWGPVESAFRNGYQSRAQLEIMLNDVEAVLRRSPAALHIWRAELDNNPELESFEFYQRARGVAGGQSAGATTSVRPATSSPAVTGIGGVFFRSADPDAIREWYRNHLGIVSDDWGGFAFEWAEKNRPEEIGYTVWGPFPDSTAYFSPTTASFMLNYRVTDLPGLMERLRGAGVQIAGEIQRHPNGAFAWILDPEGRKIELWEPVPSSEDPYLQ